jgi:hypothetical protein
MASTDRQRWARVRPALAWKHPGLPTPWTRVLERNPEAMNPAPLPGYVWLATPGKVLHTDERHLEFTDDPSCDRRPHHIIHLPTEITCRLLSRS